MKKRKISTQKELKPSPNLDLKGKEGNKLIGVLKKRVPNPGFPGRFSALIEVESTDGSATFYDSETKENQEVEIYPGDLVFLKESAVLAKAFDQIEPGSKIEVVFLGQGKAKPGQRPPYLYDVSVFE